MTWQTHVLFLKQALRQAQLRRGFCSPNPSVGALLVKDGQVIAQACHWACGSPHAESAAIQTVGKAAQGADLYVTLEPCSHYGRTPPCTDLIIQSGVREVFFGMKDPNPRVNGNGAEVLRAAGIPCTHLISPEIENFYQSYRHWLQTGLPWVTLKLAITLDGKIAGQKGKPVKITGKECQKLTHQLRAQSDAILTSIQTILLDDPQLNARIDNELIAKPLYILDSHLHMPHQAQVFATSRSLTIFHGSQASAEKRGALESRKVRCIEVNESQGGLDLKAVLTQIGLDGCHDLWVEAGGRCFQSWVNQSLAQHIYVYIAPQILGLGATPAFTADFTWSLASNKIHWSVAGEDAVAFITNPSHRNK